jgi:hypothetical protein
MTAIVGNDGDCAITGHVILFDRWSATITQNVTDVTAFGDVWAVNRGGIKGGTFSASGKGDDASAPDGDGIDADGAAVTLTVIAAHTVAGTAVISNVTHSSDVNGEQRSSFDGIFTGTITETWT